ncbi:hypothetical protein BpHYR1_013293 [Brachionus plicatilis]|uniref:Uncharacterized protein n=1 Tax=Brachionus plicatilis TaxID=10195 RepID=A0A3M7RVR3_BRAPC|nr:hypothetical protein BpHYR1_013293 [Brachionus plicatilis]
MNQLFKSPKIKSGLFLKKVDKEVDDTNQHVIDAIESTINRVNEDQNLDKTSKLGVVWTKLKNGEDLSLRKKINFNEKPGPISYASSNIDNTKLSAFIMIFDIYMLNLIVQCTNSSRIPPFLEINDNELFNNKNTIYQTLYMCSIKKKCLFLKMDQMRLFLDEKYIKFIINQKGFINTIKEAWWLIKIFVNELNFVKNHQKL